MIQRYAEELQEYVDTCRSMVALWVVEEEEEEEEEEA